MKALQLKNGDAILFSQIVSIAVSHSNTPGVTVSCLKGSGSGAFDLAEDNTAADELRDSHVAQWTRWLETQEEKPPKVGGAWLSDEELDATRRPEPTS